MTQHERNALYAARCCDWHWGDDSGRGDRAQPCRGDRYPGHAQAAVSREAIIIECARAMWTCGDWDIERAGARLLARFGLDSRLLDP